MTEQTDIQKKAVSSILVGVAQKTAILVSLGVLGVIVFTLLLGTGQRWWFIPASVLFGGALGLLNFRWLAIAVERVYLRRGAMAVTSNLAAVIISILKLSLIFVVLFIVIKYQIFHVFGLVGGLSLCFLAIVWEGATIMKNTLNRTE